VSGRCGGQELLPTAPAMKDKFTFCQLGEMKVLPSEEQVKV
jgi:hypothetical protein